MRLVVSGQSVNQILHWTQRLLFVIAVFLLGYCGFVLADSWLFQTASRHQLDQLVAVRRQAAPSASNTTTPGRLTVAVPPNTGDMIGRIEVPRLGLSVIVVEGTNTKALRRAAGHIVGTAMPGQPGNSGISAHRDTFFRPLKDIRRDDIVTFASAHGDYRYRVVSTMVVTPDEVSVLDPTQNQVLTLVTCYPFYYVGAAPDRFIVRAERVYRQGL